MTTQQAQELFVGAYQHWNEDKVPRLAAAFAFYAILALSPLLVIAVAVASSFLDESSVQGRVTQHVARNMGRPAAEFIGDLIEQTANPTAGILATLLSLIVAIYGASNLFTQLEESVNGMWGVPAPQGGIVAFLKQRLSALLLLLGFGVLFLGWLALDSWLGWLGRQTEGFPGWHLLSTVISIVFLSLIFAVSFRGIPRAVVGWRDVWFAAIVTAVGFALTKYLLSLYFAYSGVSAAYGSAGALVIILLWIYYTSQLYFFGFELVYTYAHSFGSQANRRQGAPPVMPSNEAYVS